MNPVLILRYIKGYVTFTAKGGFTERFINLCTSYNIILWDTSYSGDILKSKCQYKDISKLRKAARKSGASLKFNESYGILKDLKNQSDKLGLLYGAIFFLIFYSVMSCFVWSISVNGSATIPEENILKMAENSGLAIGTFKPNFDEFSAANSLSQSNNNEISWCAFNIKGSRAVIEIREQKQSIKDSSVPEPCNIISDADGMIIDCEIYDGIGAVTIGNAVKKGDLLINGVSENEDLSTLFVEASGKITAKTVRNFGLSFSKTAKCKKLTSTKIRYEINFFSLKIPIGIYNSKTVFSLEDHLTFNKTKLPVSLGINIGYNIKNTIRNNYEVLLSSYEKFAYEARTYNNNALLLSENPSFYETKSKFFIENNWDSLALIGKKQKISLEN